MKIQTGNGTIPLLTLVGIWSISALNAIPGLAVSPILGSLTDIFPHASDLDIQMLTSIPSLLIIPFILFSGKLTESVDPLALLFTGLSIFALSGILYLLSHTMWELIAVSALLGVGSGLIVPLSTSLISHFFKGEYRTKQFGYSSAITNITLVSATALTGYLAEIQWRLPFVVYLLPIVSMLLVPYIKKTATKDSLIPSKDEKRQGETGKQGEMDKEGIQVKKLLGYMGYYFLITYLVIIISFNLPFLMKEYGFLSGSSGILISLFFLAIMAPGFILNPLLRICGSYAKTVCLGLVALGLSFILFFPYRLFIGIGCLLAGFGYGIAQPLIYDETASIATARKVALALAFVMAMNYVAILVCPFIVDTLQSLFHVHTQRFAFALNLIVTLIAFVLTLSFHKKSLSVDHSIYTSQQK